MERSERASVSVSSSPQKNSLLNFFGCCSPSKNSSEDLKPTKRTTIPAHPATTISMGQTSAKKSFATEVDHYNSQPGNLAKQIYNEGNSEVSILKDFRGVGRVMLLGDKYKIIAKINIINVEKVESWQQMMTTVIKEPKRSGGSFDSPNAKKKETIKGSIINTMKRTFSKAEDNDYAHQPQITSQSIAAHVAKRLKCDIIIDALCGFGGNTIQFANTCNYVIAIDSNPERIACAKINAQKTLSTLDTIDFMAMDFLKIKKLSGDIVFLHPTDSRKNQMDHFSLYKNLEPELPELLTKSLEISHCVAIKLPHETDMSELASVFHSCFEKNRLHKKRFCIEVERICDTDGKPECIMVYFGDLSTIDPKEEYEALYDYMLSEESNETRARIPLQVFAAIIEKVGLGKSFKYLAEIDNKTNITRFNDFTALIIEKEIITQEDLEKLIDEESKRPSSSIFSAPNSYTPTLALLKKTSSALNDTVRSALLNGQMKKKTNESRGNNNNNIWGSNSEEESESVPGRSNKILGSKFRNLRDNSTPPSSMLPKERFDTEENNHEHFKNSHEVSDLIISSYSVDSNYLDDFSPYDETDINIRKNSRAKKEHPEIATRNRQSSMKMSRIRSKEDLTRSRKSSRHQKDTGYHFASNLTHREEHTQSDRDHDTVPFSKFKDEPNQSQRDEEDAEENQIKMGTINKYI